MVVGRSHNHQQQRNSKGRKKIIFIYLGAGEEHDDHQSCISGKMFKMSILSKCPTDKKNGQNAQQTKNVQNVQRELMSRDVRGVEIGHLSIFPF